MCIRDRYNCCALLVKNTWKKCYNSLGYGRLEHSKFPSNPSSGKISLTFQIFHGLRQTRVKNYPQVCHRGRFPWLSRFFVYFPDFPWPTFFSLTLPDFPECGHPVEVSKTSKHYYASMREGKLEKKNESRNCWYLVTLSPMIVYHCAADSVKWRIKIIFSRFHQYYYQFFPFIFRTPLITSPLTICLSLIHI